MNLKNEGRGNNLIVKDYDVELGLDKLKVYTGGQSYMMMTRNEYKKYKQSRSCRVCSINDICIRSQKNGVCMESACMDFKLANYKKIEY